MRGQHIRERFIVGNEIGRGGFGRVYGSYDFHISSTVAIKFVEKHEGWKRAAYDNEIAALGALRNLEQVVHLHYWGKFKNENYLVMDLLVDNVFKICIRNDGMKFTHNTCFDVLWNVINMAEVIHKLGFLHRDFNLTNIMMKRENDKYRMVLTDFGLAIRFRNSNGERCREDEEKVPFRLSLLASPRACLSYPLQETDDLITISYFIFIMRRCFIWKHECNEAMLRTKIAFGKAPQNFLSQEDQVFVPFLKKIFSFVSGQDVDYESIRSVLKTSFYGDSIPVERFHLQTINNELRLF